MITIFLFTVEFSEEFFKKKISDEVANPFKFQVKKIRFSDQRVAQHFKILHLVDQTLKLNSPKAGDNIVNPVIA